MSQHQDTLDYNQQMSVGAPPSVSQQQQQLQPPASVSSSHLINEINQAATPSSGGGGGGGGSGGGMMRSISQSAGVGTGGARPLQKFTSQLSQSGGLGQRVAIKPGANADKQQVTAAASSTNLVNNRSSMSKMASFVLHFPVPQSQVFQHERNQRFVVLYGFGSNKLDSFIHLLIKLLT